MEVTIKWTDYVVLYKLNKKNILFIEFLSDATVVSYPTLQ